MLRPRSLVSLLAAGVLAGVAAAQPPAAPPPVDFAALVAQLAADDFQARERAGALLLKAGEAAIPDLKAALAKAGEPEATRRLAVLVERLESARLGEPRRVTLKVERKPAKEVFAELTRQTGYKFTFTLNGNANSAFDKGLVTFDWRGTPFLQALDELCDALQVNSNVQDPGGEVNVFEGDQVNPHVAYAGPFRLVVTNVNSNRNVQVGGLSRRNPLARQPDYVNLIFMVHGEPKACLCAIGQPTALRATDELKNSLVLGAPAAGDDTPPNADANAEVPVPNFRSHSGSTSLTLNRAARQAEFVKECRVRVSVAVLAETRPEIVALDVAKGLGRKYTGRTHLLQVGAAGVQGNTATLDVTVNRKHADTDDYSWMSTMQQRFEAFDAEGKPLPAASVNQTNNGPNAVTLSLSFTRATGQKPPVIAKLHLVEWVVQHKTVEFTLKDIPLP